jgi:hypothetical protein
MVGSTLNQLSVIINALLSARDMPAAHTAKSSRVPLLL